MRIRSTYISLCIGIGLGVGHDQALAGAWVQQPRTAEIISTVSWHKGNYEFDDFGFQGQKIAFSKLESAIYAEYGLVKNWAVLGRFAFQDVSLQRGASVEAKTGIGASYLAVKRSIGEVQNWVVSAQGGISVPGSTENGLDLRLGEGALEWEVRVMAGRPWKLVNQDGFVDFQMARQFRALDNPNQWKVDTSIGYYPRSNILLMGQVFVTAGDLAILPGTRTLRSIKTQASLVWFFKPKSGVQIFMSKPVSGRNVIADSAYGISWWSRF